MGNAHVTIAAGGTTRTVSIPMPVTRSAVPYITGLVDRDAQVYRAGLDQVIQWTIPDVCPVPGGAVDCTPVLNRMAAADKAGGRHYRGRPQSGVLLNAAWLSAFGFGTLTDPQSGAAFVIPDTCNSAYQAEMDRVDQAMAAQLDSDPRLIEVMAIHRFGFEFSNEIDIHNIGLAANITALAGMGWTVAQDQANILAALPKLDSWWQHTHPISWTSTEYQSPTAPHHLDEPFTEAYMQALAKLGWIDGVNNSDLGAYDGTPPDIYKLRDEFEASPGEDQTATEAKIGGATSLVKMFTQPYLGQMVARTRSQEMPQGWETALTAAQINTAQAAFETAWPIAS